MGNEKPDMENIMQIRKEKKGYREDQKLTDLSEFCACRREKEGRRKKTGKADRLESKAEKTMLPHFYFG